MSSLAMERTSVPQRLDRALHKGTANNDILGDIEDNLAAVKSNVQLKLMMSSIAISDYVWRPAAIFQDRFKSQMELTKVVDAIRIG